MPPTPMHLHNLPSIQAWIGLNFTHVSFHAGHHVRVTGLSLSCRGSRWTGTVIDYMLFIEGSGSALFTSLYYEKVDLGLRRAVFLAASPHFLSVLDWGSSGYLYVAYFPKLLRVFSSYRSTTSSS